MPQWWSSGRSRYGQPPNEYLGHMMCCSICHVQELWKTRGRHNTPPIWQNESPLGRYAWLSNHNITISLWFATCYTHNYLIIGIVLHSVITALHTLAFSNPWLHTPSWNNFVWQSDDYTMKKHSWQRVFSLVPTLCDHYCVIVTSHLLIT